MPMTVANFLFSCFSNFSLSSWSPSLSGEKPSIFSRTTRGGPPQATLTGQVSAKNRNGVGEGPDSHVVALTPRNALITTKPIICGKASL